MILFLYVLHDCNEQSMIVIMCLQNLIQLCYLLMCQCFLLSEKGTNLNTTQIDAYRLSIIKYDYTIPYRWLSIPYYFLLLLIFYFAYPCSAVCSRPPALSGTAYILLSMKRTFPPTVNPSFEPSSIVKKFTP